MRYIIACTSENIRNRLEISCLRKKMTGVKYVFTIIKMPICGWKRVSSTKISFIWNTKVKNGLRVFIPFLFYVADVSLDLRAVIFWFDKNAFAYVKKNLMPLWGKKIMLLIYTTFRIQCKKFWFSQAHFTVPVWFI